MQVYALASYYCNLISLTRRKIQPTFIERTRDIAQRRDTPHVIVTRSLHRTSSRRMISRDRQTSSLSFTRHNIISSTRDPIKSHRRAARSLMSIHVQLLIVFAIAARIVVSCVANNYTRVRECATVCFFASNNK